MSLDVSEAIALAKDLLKTSSEFQAHDPELAAQFAGRAFEICDDLGIDRDLIGEQPADVVDQPGDSGPDNAAFELTSPSVVSVDEETRQTSKQLRDLLEQQARVLQNVREMDAEPKPKKRSFKLFGRSADQDFGGELQSA